MKKIFVKSVNWVGDAIMVTPMLRVLRRVFPEAEITLLARPSVADVFEANPDIDRLWVAHETASFRQFRQIAARMRHERFDLGIALPNSFGSALLLAMGRARRRLGYKRDGRGLLLTDAISATPKIRKVHEVEYYLNLLAGFCDLDTQPRELLLRPAPGANDLLRRALAKENLPDTFLEEDTPLVGISPGAAFGTAKRWLPERFAAIADHLTERYGARVMILGTPSERDVAEKIARVAKQPVIILSGAIPLRVAIALMSRMRIFLTNDSGAMHLASALDIPLVAVFGPTKPENTSPYHPQARIVRHEHVDCPDHPCMQRHCSQEHNCMKSVLVEEVISAIDKQMEE